DATAATLDLACTTTRRRTGSRANATIIAGRHLIETHTGRRGGVARRAVADARGYRCGPGADTPPAQPGVAGRAGAPPGTDPGRTRWTIRQPACAASNATCTTARRPSWSRSR